AEVAGTSQNMSGTVQNMAGTVPAPSVSDPAAAHRAADGCGGDFSRTQADGRVSVRGRDGRMRVRANLKCESERAGGSNHPPCGGLQVLFLPPHREGLGLAHPPSSFL